MQQQLAQQQFQQQLNQQQQGSLTQVSPPIFQPINHFQQQGNLMTGENLAIFDQLANDIVKKRILEFKELFIKEKNRSKY
jgi:hypothetical protein